MSELSEKDIRTTLRVLRDELRCNESRHVDWVMCLRGLEAQLRLEKSCVKAHAKVGGE